MKHRVYMRDWYFNAGIVGFLRVISNDAMPDDLAKIKGLELGDNYIEFDDMLLEGFRDKFTRMAFCNFNEIDFYKRRIASVLDKIDNFKDEYSIQKICKEEFFYEFDSDKKQSGYQRFINYVLKQKLDQCTNLDELKKVLQKSFITLDESDNYSLYESISLDDKGQSYLNNFTVEQFKGAAGLGDNLKNINDCIIKINEHDYKKKLKNNDICLSCQERRSIFDFNNAVSSIIGFNSDNANWIWGLKATKVKFCAVCSLMYYCALFGFIRQVKYYDNKPFNCYYTINMNQNVYFLYHAIISLQKTYYHLRENIKSKSFFIIIKETLRLILDKQVEAVIGNINFIEIPVNSKLSNKKNNVYTYYQYNYNINPEVAEFINKSTIPTGSYIINRKSKNSYTFSIDDELLYKTMNYALTYSDISQYVYYSMSDTVDAKFNLYQLCNYIFSYINNVIKPGGKMDDRKNVINKAFFNGKELANLLKANNRDNQIDGIVYGLLNDLKISDREKFLDKYIRLMMSHNMELKFGSNDEMSDTDSFLQFGYSFINGLLSNQGKKIEKESSNG